MPAAVVCEKPDCGWATGSSSRSLIECTARLKAVLRTCPSLIECTARLKAVLRTCPSLIECTARLKAVLRTCPSLIECTARLKAVLQTQGQNCGVVAQDSTEKGEAPAVL